MKQEDKNSRIAILSASLLTLGAISCASLGLWRMGSDLDWTGDFVVKSGFLSHWQVWIGAAVGMQYTSWWLGRYGRDRAQARMGDGAGSQPLMRDSEAPTVSEIG
jgi:hypothetical protein